jgi:hypothetical protein
MYQEPLASIADEEPAAVHAGLVAASLQRGFGSVSLCVLGVTFGLLLIASVASGQLDDVAAKGGESVVGGEQTCWEGNKKFWRQIVPEHYPERTELTPYSAIALESTKCLPTPG